MMFLFDAFKREGLGAALTGTPQRFGFKPYSQNFQFGSDANMVLALFS